MFAATKLSMNLRVTASVSGAREEAVGPVQVANVVEIATLISVFPVA